MPYNYNYTSSREQTSEIIRLYGIMDAARSPPAEHMRASGRRGERIVDLTLPLGRGNHRSLLQPSGFGISVQHAEDAELRNLRYGESTYCCVAAPVTE